MVNSLKTAERKTMNEKTPFFLIKVRVLLVLSKMSLCVTLEKNCQWKEQGDELSQTAELGVKSIDWC